ncbi:MAG: hypothetical protein ACE37I_05835 [Rubinisphaera brasiliensis]|uniref:hypothetical protein n=1 Tax=Rubinisphaera brasiliensis TaxID=119 RepID=UPI000315D3CC|nr:hypothetical protein [Rubinisphaera brasiliensis]MBR9801706.1 hypothetical protein [bacterium]
MSHSVDSHRCSSRLAEPVVSLAPANLASQRGSLLYTTSAIDLASRGVGKVEKIQPVSAVF